MLVFATKVEFSELADRVDLYFRLNQIQEAAARHVGKFRMNIGLSLESVIWSIFMRVALQEYGRE